jgi:hypothetical protein
VLARAMRREPFGRLDEAILQGFVAAVVKNVVVLGLLGGAGLFRQPVLLAVDAAILLGGAALLRPLLAPAASWRPGLPTPMGLLLGAALAAPILLQLASPVVPFIDVLPNHVAPAEHLRTFGTLTSLTDTQSPIYGPSRIFLGYTALLGAITTMTDLPAGQALAAFILPSTVLVIVGMRRMAEALGGSRIVGWSILAFAMTTSVARLGDARATVIVLPLVAWLLATVADRLVHRDPGGGEPGGENQPRNLGGGAPGVEFPSPDPVGRPRDLGGRIEPGDRIGSVLAGLGLGAAMLVHPVIGFLAAATIVVVVLARPGAIAGFAVPALATGAIVALPQAATMIGISLPPLALVVAVIAGPAVGWLLGSSAPIRGGFVLLGRLAAVVLAFGVIVAAGPVVRAAVAGAQPLVSVMELTVVASIAAVVLRARAARSLVLWAAIAAGFVVATLTQLVPEEGSGLLGDALRFELPKTLQYWVPVFVAVLGASGIAAVMEAPRLPDVARGLAIVGFVGTAALPIRSAPIDAFHLGEHRLSETLSIALRWAQRGFWSGFPDPRYVVDAPRQELLDAVRAEISAGRIGPDTPVLHVAGSFQQWVATPLGVFDGVTEVDVTPDYVLSIHTVGGKLHPLDDLDALLAAGPPGGRTYGFVLYEPDSDPENLPPETRDALIAAGFRPVFSNSQGELLALPGSLK